MADAVGLGKTIQALLIVCELCARGLTYRTLILTPASLRDQWATEMSQRFGLRAAIFDHASLATMAATLPCGINPWNTAQHIVASIDLVKRPEVRAAVDEVTFDVLIVDEAHHLTPGSDRGALVADLATRAQWVVLITATPHSGDEVAYRFLCSLGEAGDRADLVVFRRSSSQVQVAAPRRERSVAIVPTLAEQALLDRTLDYARALWRSTAANDGAKLVASVIARRAASSAVAALQTLQRRVVLLKGNIPPEHQDSLPWDEDDGGDLGVSDTVLALTGLSDQTTEVAWLEQLVLLAEAAAGASSKVAFVSGVLRRTTEPLIVFSEYRDVVTHVASQLSALTTVTVLHGGLSSFARTNTIQSFLDGRARVLVTTDAAGEGLNLHGRCRFVINLELPWNPLRIEQRVGRVDRLGQRRRVHARHLYYRGSFEELVLTRLTERRDVAAGVLGERDSDCLCEPRPNENITADEYFGSSLIERRLETLTARSKAHARPRRPIYSWSTRRRTPLAKATLVFAGDLVDPSGRLVQREVIPLEIHGRLPSLCAAKRALTELVDDPRVRASMDREIARRLAVATAAVAPAAVAYERRVAALAAAIAQRRRARLYQGSLFDRRTEQQSHAHESAIAGWLAHLERRLAAARALRQLRPARPRLVAAWSDPVTP